MFMPLEFSAAAYRFGHSMVRPGYRLNDDVGPFAIFPLADLPGDPGLTGFDEFPRNWAIDWGRFLDLEPRPFGDEDDPANAGNPKRTQLAYKIDTSIVNPLSMLPAPSPATLRRASPSATCCAAGGCDCRAGRPSPGRWACGCSRTPRSRSASSPATLRTSRATSSTRVAPRSRATVRCGPTCWRRPRRSTRSSRPTDGTKTITTRRLGNVGGRIVTETFVGILAGDSSSFLNQNPLWKPSYAVDGEFGLRELVKAAREG